MYNSITQLLNWTANTGLIFLSLAVILWFTYFKQLSKSIKILGIYLLSNLIVQIVADIIWRNYMNNLPLLHLNTLLEFVLLSLFFKEVYIDQKFFKKYHIHFITVMGLLLILNSIFFESIYGYNSNAKTVVQVLILGYVVLYFFDSYGKVDYSKRGEQAIGLICFTIFLYYSGSLFIFMFNRFFINENKEIFREFWIFNAFLTVVFQFLSLIAILLLLNIPKKLFLVNSQE